MSTYYGTAYCEKVQHYKPTTSTTASENEYQSSIYDRYHTKKKKCHIVQSIYSLLPAQMFASFPIVYSFRELIYFHNNTHGKLIAKQYILINNFIFAHKTIQTDSFKRIIHNVSSPPLLLSSPISASSLLNYPFKL